MIKFVLDNLKLHIPMHIIYKIKFYMGLHASCDNNSGNAISDRKHRIELFLGFRSLAFNIFTLKIDNDYTQ